MATVVDDTDPLLGWFGSSWAPPATQKEDLNAKDYSNTTFHTSINNGDYCMIAWHGTDLAVYGARRDNHGIYGVSVDDGPIQYYSGYSATAQFLQVLFSTSGMTEGDHTIKISNENARNTGQYPNYIWLDIDQVAFTGTLLNAAAPTPADASSVAQSSDPTTTSVSSTASASQTSSTASAISTTASSSNTDLASVARYTGSSSVVTTITRNSQTSSGPRTLTTGTPEIPNTSSTAESANAEQESDNNKTVAISVTVIVIAAVVIATILGLFWWRRRRRQREEDDQDYLAPESSWR